MKISKVTLQNEISSALACFLGLNRIYIGYSGGVDSHVLLHACAAIPELKKKITAVYIHHGLQKEADDWAIHCQQISETLDVHFLIKHVNAVATQGESPEEAARNARYNAFESLIEANDVLLIAQHREDQLETVLLQLFRGSGLKGLAGMPEKMAFGKGWLLRPLLNVGKDIINNYAIQNQLQWIEDPSNQSNVYDRNFLRQEIIPQLKQRWSSLDKTVARTAKHCAEAQVLQCKMTKTAFETVFNSDDKTIAIPELLTYSLIEQRLILRQWFENLALRMPSQNFVQRILDEVVAARIDSSPILAGQGITIRRYRTKLYAVTHALTGFETCYWQQGKTTLTLSNQQVLTILPSECGISSELWNDAKIMVKMRQGGEKIVLPNRTGHHDLKKLFQEANIPPWQRDVMPLIYLNDELAVVGTLWIASKFYVTQNAVIISNSSPR